MRNCTHNLSIKFQGVVLVIESICSTLFPCQPNITKANNLQTTLHIILTAINTLHHFTFYLRKKAICLSTQKNEP